MKAKKLMASVLCASMLLSLGGCALFDKDDEGVLAAVTDYAEAVKKGKVSKIADLLYEGNDLEDDIEAYIAGSTVETPDGYADVVSAIADTISYEIDEESVESSKKNKEGSVAITWTIVDYDSIYETVIEDDGNLEAFIDALSDNGADTMEISQTLDLVYENDTWLIDDSKLKDLYEVYDFYTAALSFVFIPPLTDYIDYTIWYYSDDSVYENYSQIELDIVTFQAGEDVPFEFTYEYYRDGELIFTSDVCEDQCHWIEAYYGPNYDSAAQVNEMGYLVPGQYRCVMYDLAGHVLADSTCTVEVSEVATADVSMVDYIEWYYSDDGVYENYSQIELDIIPTSEGQSVVWTFYYEYYIDGELVYVSDSCSYHGYLIESYYGHNYDSEAQTTPEGYLIPGEYTCIIYDLSGNILAQDTCTVEVN